MHRFLLAIVLVSCVPAEDSESASLSPRSVDDVEIFGPVRNDDLVAVVGKCMPAEQNLWLTFADEGPHLTVSFVASATVEAASCVQTRLLSLGLTVVEADTAGESTGSSTTG